MTDGMRKLLDRLCDHATWAEVSLISDLRFVVDLIKSLAAELEQATRERDEAWKVVESVSGQNEIMADVLGRVKRERDAAVRDVEELCMKHSYSTCHYCKYEDDDYVSNNCMDCHHGKNWQWRGVKED